MGPIRADAQLNVVIENGVIYIKDGGFGPPDAKKYSAKVDSLDKILRAHPDDTTSLFERALLLEQFNNQLAKATSFTKDPIENLTIAKDMAEHAIALNMKDIKLKVLRSQIYADLVYRFSVSETWKFTSKQISDRKIKYNTYKGLANKYYDELALLDKNNAYDYQKLKMD
jgi:hypothetical protein